MKKILLIIITVFVLFLENVNADYVTVGNTKYLIKNELYCGSDKVIPNYYIEKTGKLVVFDDKSNEYIWGEGNKCRKKNDQDLLDELNSRYEDISIDEETYTFYHITSDILFSTFYIKPTGEFNPNETYYELDYMEADEVKNPTADNYENYYVKIILKSPDNAVFDPNETYYQVNNLIATIATDVTNENIVNYFVKTTEEEINLKIDKYYFDKSKFDDLKINSSYIDYRFFGDTPIIKVYDNEGNIRYSNNKFKEITRYYNYEVEKNNNYVVYVNKDQSKIMVYDSKEKNKIYEYTYSGNEAYAGFEILGTSIIIYGYRNSDTITTYINLYKPLEGDNQKYKGNDIKIKFNGSYYSFEKLEIDGKTVPTNKYTITKGSTIITLKKDYLDSLKDGKYEITAVYSDGGRATATLTVGDQKEDEQNPDTYDNIYTYIILCVTSSMALYLSYKKLKKSL